MNPFIRYLERYSTNEQVAQVIDPCTNRPEMIIMIPAFKEDHLIETLESLRQCDRPKESTAVIVVVNHPEGADTSAIHQNELTLIEVAEWRKKRSPFFEVITLYAPSLPAKWAGVGWARKIGMDHAVKIFAEQSCADGIIVSFDADSSVEKNYFVEIENAFRKDPKANFFNIHFEHPFEKPGLDPELRRAIIRYELYLRYFKNGLRHTGYPHAIHTVGSSFAVRASAYVRQGGMNRRQAGEDFYFLYKLVPLEHYGIISTTTVYPGCRISDRVPFGTGAAMNKYLEGTNDLNMTYSYDSFEALSALLSHPEQYFRMELDELKESLYSLPEGVGDYIEHNTSLPEELIQLRKNCSNTKTFVKRFYHLVDAFWMMRFLNTTHGTWFQKKTLISQAALLLPLESESLKSEAVSENVYEKMLNNYRKLDKQP